MSRLKLEVSPSPTLRSPNFDVALPLNQETKLLISQMKFACKKFRGIGLAAPQIGKNLNLAIIDLSEYEIPPFAILNPKITSTSFKKHVMEEGCLSLPGKFGRVRRPEKVTVKFFTEEGKEVTLSADGMLSKVFQHEIDHLGGVLIADKWDPESVHELTQEQRRKSVSRRAKSSQSK